MAEEEESWDSEIKGRQRLFVLNLCTNPLYFMNQRQAYIEAYTKTKDGQVIERPSEAVADAAASRLLRDVKVKKAVVKLLTLSQPEADTVNSYILLHDLFLQATYNPADIIGPDGQLKCEKLEDLGDLAKCVEEIIPTKFGYRVRLTSRKFAQDKLLKYYDLVRDVPEINANLPVVYLAQKEDDEALWEQQANGN